MDQIPHMSGRAAPTPSQLVRRERRVVPWDVIPGLSHGQTTSCDFAVLRVVHDE